MSDDNFSKVKEAKIVVFPLVFSYHHSILILSRNSKNVFVNHFDSLKNGNLHEKKYITRTYLIPMLKLLKWEQPVRFVSTQMTQQTSSHINGCGLLAVMAVTHAVKNEMRNLRAGIAIDVKIKQSDYNSFTQEVYQKMKVVLKHYNKH